MSAADPGGPGAYEITAEFLVSRSVTANVGHIGFMFNVVDEYNYDAFHFK